MSLETGAAAGIKKPTIIKGHIKVNKEISIDSKSCLVITLREAIYCAKFEECPDKTIATHVIRDLMVSPDNGIPYNLTVASKLKPNRYLIEATLNRGWCHIDDKDDKKWLRDGDLFNNIEHSIEIDRPGDYNEDIVVIELKEEETTSGDGKSSLISKSVVSLSNFAKVFHSVSECLVVNSSNLPGLGKIRGLVPN